MRLAGSEPRGGGFLVAERGAGFGQGRVPAIERSKAVLEEGLARRRTAEQIVPVLGADRSEATAVGSVAAECGGGAVAGRVGVVGAEGAGSVEGLQPARESGGEAGGGSDERVGRQGGSEQQNSGEGVDGALNQKCEASHFPLRKART